MKIKQQPINNNCIVEFNKTPAILWGKGISKPARAYVDGKGRNCIQTDNVDKILYQANKFEVFFLKYLPILIYAIFFSNLQSNLISYEAICLSGIFYILGIWVKQKFGLQFSILLFSSVPFIYVIFGFYNFHFLVEYSIGMVLDYTLQYIFLIFILKYFIDNFFTDSFKYYRVDGFLFRYIKIIEEDREFKDKRFSLLKRVNRYFIGLLTVLSLFFGTFSITEQVKRNIIKKEYKLKLEKRALEKGVKDEK
jgi:hypothetical protein